MTRADEKKYSYLWTSEKDDWVLVCIPDDPNNAGSQAMWAHYRRRMEDLGLTNEANLLCVIRNTITNRLLIIEDDRVSHEVKQRMAKEGVRIVEN